MKTRAHKYGLSLLSLVVLTAAPHARAQQATPPTNNNGPDATAPASASNDLGSDVVQLDRFVVGSEKDNGYTAIDSLSGGRQSSPVRVTPASISSMTRQFVDDLNITDLQNALKWSLNAQPASFRNGLSGGSGGNVFNFWAVSIRGDIQPQGGNSPTKNYFPIFQVQDTYNVDRIEIDSGPNSILFGIGNIGGSYGTYTKTANFSRNFTDLNVQTSNFGGYRTTVDSNQILSSNFSLRVNALFSDEKGFRDGDFNKKKAIDLAGTWKISDSTKLWFEAEGFKEEKTVFNPTMTDGVSQWDHSTSAPTWDDSLGGAGGTATMSGWGANHYYVWNPTVGLFDWKGGTRSAGTGDKGLAAAYLRPTGYTYYDGSNIMALPSKNFVISPSDSVVKPEDYNVTLNLEQRFGQNSELIISGYRYQDDEKATNFEGAGGGQGFGAAYDLNKQLPDGTANPNYGKLYSDFFLDRQLQDHWVNEIRAQYNYHFLTNVAGIPLNQLFSFSGGEQITEYNARQYLGQITNNYNPTDPTDTLVWGRVYWDQAQAPLRVPTSYNGQNISYLPWNAYWYDFDSKQTIKYVGGFSQTRLWDDRLNISLGLRHDSYRNWKLNARPPFPPAVIAEDSGNTYTIGGIGYITDWLGIVGNISENFAPAAGGLAPSIQGTIFGPSTGRGKTIGLRLSTKDGRYYASFSYYHDQSKNVIGGDLPDFQGLWNDYFKAGGTANDIGPSGTVTGSGLTQTAQMSYTDTYDVKYTGYEFELTATPIKSLRIQLHYSRPRGERTNDSPDARAYFAAHLPEWQAVANSSTALNQKVQTDLDTAQKLFNGTAVPSITSRELDYMANAFVTYTLPEFAKGFEIGAGFSTFGEQYATPSDVVNGQRVKSPGYTTFSALVRYVTNFHIASRNVRSTFQINADNLFNRDVLIYRTYVAASPTSAQGADYDILPPRTITFSAAFDF